MTPMPKDWIESQASCVDCAEKPVAHGRLGGVASTFCKAHHDAALEHEEREIFKFYAVGPKGAKARFSTPHELALRVGTAGWREAKADEYYAKDLEAS